MPVNYIIDKYGFRTVSQFSFLLLLGVFSVCLFIPPIGGLPCVSS